MSRKYVDYNPIPGKRLKQILKEQGITQTQAGEFLHLSQKTISHMVNGESSVTNETADLMIKEFPQYRKAWLLGIDDYKTNREMLLQVIADARKEGTIMENALFSLASLSGFEITKNHPQVDNPVTAIHSGYSFTKDGKTVSMNLTELNRFENEICDFIEFRLLHMAK